MTEGGAAGGARRLPVLLSSAGAFVRAGDWWEHKILPLLAVYAATALVLRVPLAAIWPGGVELLAALSALAAFAALINDLCDAEEDRVGGKPNILSRHPRSRVLLALAVAAALGSMFAWLWRDDLMLAATYLAAWAAFALYSVPPVRLKAQGGWGVAAIALGEAALPSLVAAQLCGHAAAAAVPRPWIAAVFLWSLCHGMRAILWHQLRDAGADARALVDTFVRRRGDQAARRLAGGLVFPVEIASLASMLVMAGSVLPWAGLGLYLCVLGLKMRLRAVVPVVVDPVPRHVLLLQDYYVYYLPLALLSAAAARHPLDGGALLVWLALFPRAFLRLVRGPFRALQRPASRQAPRADR